MRRIVIAVCLLAVVSLGWAQDKAPERPKTIPGGPINREAFQREVCSLYQAGKYQELDDLARKLRTTREKWDEGIWRLENFYFGLGMQKGKRYSDDDTPWLEWRKGFDKWIEAFPESVTPRVLLAQHLFSYA